jgi:hypothetical protein
MFRLGFPQLLIIAVIAMLVFGPKRPPWQNGPGFDALTEPTPTVNKTFFIVLGIIVILVALAEVWLAAPTQ